MLNGHPMPPDNLLDQLKEKIATAEQTLSEEAFLDFLQERPIRKVLFYQMAMEDDQPPPNKPTGKPGTLSEFYRAPPKPTWSWKG